MVNPGISGTTQYVCAGWAMVGNSPTGGTTRSVVMTITNDATLTWQWTTYYWLNSEAGPNGLVNVSSGWQKPGDTMLITPRADPYYHFTKWTGNVDGDDECANPLSLLMNASQSVTANFAANVLTNTGTPEWWLAKYGWTNDLDTAVTNDPDHDGTATWQEWIAGTDPTNRLSVLSVTNLSTSAAGYVLSWPSVSNRIYWVDRSTNLIQPSFESLATNLPATPPMNVYTDQVPVLDRAFYRIRVENP